MKLGNRRARAARWQDAILVAALLGACAGSASAQPSPMTCNLSSLTLTARAEGKAELMGDLIISCAGGTILTTLSTPAPTVNLTLTLPQTITSRVLSGINLSEALLLIDEPGTAPTGTALVPGYGADATPVACPGANTTGCTVYPNTAM